jgi:hypothetical protein
LTARQKYEAHRPINDRKRVVHGELRQPLDGFLKHKEYTMKYSFNRGTWIDNAPLPDQQDNEEFEDYLRRLGFSVAAASFGNEYGSQVEIYESIKGDSYYVTVSPTGDACREIYLPDFPSFMMFVRDYVSAFSAESSNAHLQETLKLLEKMFQVQHGHPAHEICSQCDPVGWKRNVEARRKRHR